MRDFVVIPAHNESNNIISVLERAKPYCPNLIVVDDGSSDDTSRKAQGQSVIVITHAVNLGKGAALKTGCDYALEQGAERITVLDADGQHDPREIPLFWQALKTADIVYSFRRSPLTMPGVLRFGNNFINGALKLLFNISVNDSQCGYRAFTAAAYKKIRWSASDYFMETEMIIRAGKNKLRSDQIPIETIYSDSYKGTTVFDGVKIIFKLVRERIL